MQWVAIEQGIKTSLDAFEEKEALFEEQNFIERTDAIDRIQFRVIDPIDYILSTASPTESLIHLKSRAEKLVRSLEWINQEMFARLQQEIRSGSYLNFINTFSEYARYILEEKQASSIGYDVLDTFVTGLLEVDDLYPEETISKETDMVFYQPTPARVVWELVQRGGISADDVFYDLGSGLGQVAILVHLICGGVTRGIEVEPIYCEYARLSAQKLSLNGVQFINADARDAHFSDGTVFYLYTPFKGKILKDVMKKLEAAARVGTLPIRICTYGPCTLDVWKEDWLELEGGFKISEHELAVFRSRFQK